MFQSDVSFIQLNMKKAFAAAVELNASIKKVKDYICLISEPHIFKGKLSSLPPKCQAISQENNPRTAIIASRNLRIIKLGHLSNRDCTVALLKNKKESILITSIYMDIKMEMIPGWLEKVVEFARSKKEPTDHRDGFQCT